MNRSRKKFFIFSGQITENLLFVRLPFEIFLFDEHVNAFLEAQNRLSATARLTSPIYLNQRHRRFEVRTQLLDHFLDEQGVSERLACFHRSHDRCLNDHLPIVVDSLVHDFGFFLVEEFQRLIQIDSNLLARNSTERTSVGKTRATCVPLEVSGQSYGISLANITVEFLFADIVRFQ